MSRLYYTTCCEKATEESKTVLKTCQSDDERQKAAATLIIDVYSFEDDAPCATSQVHPFVFRIVHPMPTRPFVPKSDHCSECGTFHEMSMHLHRSWLIRNKEASWHADKGCSSGRLAEYATQCTALASFVRRHRRQLYES